DDGLAVAGTQLVLRSLLRQFADEQSALVQGGEPRRLAAVVDRLDVGGVGQIDPHHVMAVLAMPAEIVKRVGMATMQDGVGFGGQIAHRVAPSCRMRSAPLSATRSQSGRCASSYSIS